MAGDDSDCRAFLHAGRPPLGPEPRLDPRDGLGVGQSRRILPGGFGRSGGVELAVGPAGGVQPGDRSWMRAPRAFPIIGNSDVAGKCDRPGLPPRAAGAGVTSRPVSYPAIVRLVRAVFLRSGPGPTD